VKKQVDYRKLPYFETKVVKVRKTEEENLCGGIRIGDKGYRVFRKGKGVPYLKEIKQKKGNWANGENLDKIKFPCFCSFMYGAEKCYGEINKNLVFKTNEFEFTMTDLTKQTKRVSIVYGYPTLKEMIEELKVKIKPGKVVIFEEEA